MLRQEPINTVANSETKTKGCNYTCCGATGGVERVSIWEARENRYVVMGMSVRAV